ncbi:MAG: hypothetical protein Q9166_007804 [cf. Caloplaca sp. 2 TL-2023]
MIEDIEDEIEVINSIYGENTLQRAVNPTPGDYVLTVPQREVSLRLSIPDQYPSTCMQITAVEGVGSTSRKGYGNHSLTIAREVMQKVFTPGQVCVFDLLQELEQALDQESAITGARQETSHESENKHAPNSNVSSLEVDASDGRPVPPQWTLSTTVTEKKSIFLARACAVKSTLEVQAAISHFLSIDKRASKATHNISAYRIRTLADGNEFLYQDCDDDGEDAAGGRLLKLLQMMEVWNVLVVVSRWYGGVRLGPARFGIINGVAREAVVAGGFAKSSHPHR